MRNALALTVSLTFFVSPILSEFLRAGGSNFYYGKDKVFLSGVNFAWNSYGYDFGNGRYQTTKPVFEDWLTQVHNNGGNTVRLWVHVEGFNTPQFDSNGYVTGPDQTGTLIPELASFLDAAYNRDILVILVLWNGAVMTNDNYKNLIWDDSKNQRYIDKALIPMVRALKSKPALAAWEIMNEPEGSVATDIYDATPCFDTKYLTGTGAGFSNANIPMKYLLRFINWQSAAIHKEDPKALVTVGSWCEIPHTDEFGFRNYYKDSCLVKAGGKSEGVIDFYQIHTYSWKNKFSARSPFKVVNRWAYKDDNKPLIIGEFAQVCSEDDSMASLFDRSYKNGFSGILTWQYNAGGSCSDGRDIQNEGLRSIRYRNDQSNGQGGLVNIDVR